ncbi:MAG: FHA domain-containing protein, partial [Chloroflexota bacterium]|nr:FHA domain-containing protein [Chloroflexota bacterium]
MQHRQPGSPDPDEAPAYDPSGRLPSAMARDDGGPFGDTRFFDGDDEAGPSEGGPPSARLRAEHGSVDVIEVTLDRSVLDIGRRLTNDIVIHDTNVSRQHARLVRGPDGYTIEDTQSSNGTFVNDERVFGPRQLRNGDVIRIGDAVFVYEVKMPSVGPSPTLAPPP